MTPFAASVATGFAAALAVGLLTRRWVPGRRIRKRQDRAAWLEQLGVGPVRFAAMSIGAALAAFCVIFALSGMWPVAVVPAVILAFLPKAYWTRQHEKRLEAIQRAWPDGIRDLVGSIGAGLSLTRALAELEKNGPPALRHALAGLEAQTRSLGLDVALESIRGRLADPMSDRVIEILLIAHDRGGSIVTSILSDLAESAGRDVWALEEIRTSQLEHQINARVVFALPWLVLLAVTLRQGAFRDFYSSPAGLAVIALGAALSLGGMAVVSRLGRRPTEPRVFSTEVPGA